MISFWASALLLRWPWSGPLRERGRVRVRGLDWLSSFTALPLLKFHETGDNVTDARPGAEVRKIFVDRA